MMLDLANVAFAVASGLALGVVLIGSHRRLCWADVLIFLLPSTVLMAVGSLLQWLAGGS